MNTNITETAGNSFTQIVNDYKSLESRAMQLNSLLAVINNKQREEIEKRTKISKRLETLLKMLPGGVIVLDQNGVIVESNEAAEHILGYKNLVTEKWSNIVEQSCAPQLDDGLEVSLHNGKRISVATNALPDELGQIILITDLTKTRELQSKINHQNKLLAMGEMMSCLAHQVKTPLSAALLYSSHLCNNNLCNDRKHLYAGKVKERLMHLDDLLQSMLVYVKGYIPASDIIDIDKLFINLSENIKEIIYGKNIKILFCNDISNKKFKGNLSAVISACVNLIVNSIDASTAGSYICVFAKSYGENIDLVVSDKGAGNSMENLPKVSQAFFSTKTTVTGLGLSIAEIIAKSCGGKLCINSSREKGTKVSIRLPCFNEEKVIN